MNTGPSASDIHAQRLKALLESADAVRGTAERIAQLCAETMDCGGVVSIQPQMNYLVGALARMSKDWGVIEQLQGQGVTRRRPMLVKAAAR